MTTQIKTTKQAPPDPATPSIDTFIALIKSGIELWSRAGEILVKLVEADPNVYSEIVSKNSFVTFDMLLAFERMGRRQLYPPLLMDASPGAKRLLELPYDQQEKYCKEPIEVAVNQDITEKKYLKELSNYEASVVFNGTGVRSVSDQRTYIQSHKPKGRHKKSSQPVSGLGTFVLKISPSGGVVAERVSDNMMARVVQVYEREGVSQCIVKLVRKT